MSEERTIPPDFNPEGLTQRQWAWLNRKVGCAVTFVQCFGMTRLHLQVIAKNPRYSTYAIVIASVNDPHGEIIANVMMPHHDWQPYRERGVAPVATGLMRRDMLLLALAIFDPEAAHKLRSTTGTVAVVIDYGVADVFLV